MSATPSGVVGHPGARVLVVGLGNPLLGDDGVGWRVVDAVERRLGASSRRPDVELDRQCVGGLGLMERLVGYRRAILVDAYVATDARPGRVWTRPLQDVATRAAGHLDSAHDAPLAIALAAGRALGADLPRSIDVVAVEAERADTFADELSGPVAKAVPIAVDTVIALLAAE